MHAKMRSKLRDDAMRLRLAAVQANLQLGAALNPVADRLLAADRGQDNGPSEAQLEEVRRRYLVHQALDQAQRTAWAAVRDTEHSQPLEDLLMLAYRLTVFAAACAVLWQALR